jgi:hypothetical protein
MCGLPHGHSRKVVRCLWNKMALLLSTGTTHASDDSYFQQVVQFLRVPFLDAPWTVSVEEQASWDNVLSAAISAGETDDTGMCGIMECIPSDTDKQFSARLWASLLCRAQMVDPLPLRFLAKLDSYLTNIFSSTLIPEFPTALEMLALLGKKIEDTPPLLIMPLLRSVKNSTCTWIRGRDESPISIKHYNTIVRIFFHAALHQLIYTRRLYLCISHASPH